MARSVIVKLTDDIDGGDADETVVFGIDGRSYEIDLSEKNAAAFREALDQYITKARPLAEKSARRTRSESSNGPTLYSQLSELEKERFRKWADMPNARRIGDARVQDWLDAGKPA